MLRLDALRQDDRLENDFIIEVVYLRKSYTDAPIYGKWLESKVDLYELFTGRKARGILMVVVGRDRMKEEGQLPLTRLGVNECERQIELEVFTCTEIGFHPGPVSLAMAQSYLEEPDKSEKKSSMQLSLPEDTVKFALLQRFIEEAKSGSPGVISYRVPRHPGTSPYRAVPIRLGSGPVEDDAV